IILFTKLVFFCQNNAKLVRKVLIFYQIGILLPKQCEIGKNMLISLQTHIISTKHNKKKKQTGRLNLIT
ncbi:MAG: hypothetical protein ACTJE6_02735, partial [Pseudolactococcus laudensis]